MLSPIVIQARRPANLVYNAGVTGLIDVRVRLYSGTTELAESPVSCREHASLSGVYIADVTIDSTGSIAAQWESSGFPTVRQNILVVLATYATTIRVWNSDTRERHGGVRVMILQHVGTGRQLISEITTDSDGECSLELPEGQYRIALTKDRVIFTANGFELDVGFLDVEEPCLLDTKAIAVPDSGYESPADLVTMTASLIGASGAPLRFRNVVVTVLSSVPYASGSNAYIVAEDRVVEQSDSNGQVSITLVPGSVVEVAVENTQIARRFTVPSSDFDLYDHLDTDDYYDVQQPDYTPIRES